METTVPNPDANLDPIPIDDQELYDWGIEHRMDQYYGSEQQQYQYQQQQQQQQINNNSSSGKTQLGMVSKKDVNRQLLMRNRHSF